jgi:hypothetical protein
MNHDQHIFIRLTTADVERLDALAERYPILTRSGVARAAIRLGLDAIERSPMALLEQPTAKRGGDRRRKAAR